LIGICYHCNRLKDTREIGKYELCEEHQNLKQYQPKVKKTSIPKMSKKMKRQISEYSKVRAQFLEENPNCQCGCGRKATEIHHKMHRNGISPNGISLLLDDKYFMAVNRVCHTLIHSNTKQSTEKGWIIQKYGKI